MRPTSGDPRRCPFVRAVADGDEPRVAALLVADGDECEPAVEQQLRAWAVEVWD